jgi:hypothetical protein
VSDSCVGCNATPCHGCYPGLATRTWKSGLLGPRKPQRMRQGFSPRGRR